MFVLLFFLGSSIASFLNLCAYRIPKKISIIYPGSSCEGCNSIIEKLYIMPIIGYLISFGKCKKCGHKIPYVYPLSEALLGIIAIVIYLKTGLSVSFIHYMVLLSFLYIVSIIDLTTMEVHMSVILSFFLLLLITSTLRFFSNEIYAKDFLVSLISSFIFFSLFFLFGTLKWFGYGDSFVVLIMMMFLNFNQGVLSIILSFIIGGIVSIFILFSRKYSIIKMPFCPFLCIGGIMSILFSEKIINFYISII